MRHGDKQNNLGRKSAHRDAMLANMACSLIMHKRINTTVAKAKALRTYIAEMCLIELVDFNENMLAAKAESKAAKTRRSRRSPKKKTETEAAPATPSVEAKPTESTVSEPVVNEAESTPAETTDSNSEENA